MARRVQHYDIMHDTLSTDEVTQMADTASFLLTLPDEEPAVTGITRHREADGTMTHNVVVRDKDIAWGIAGMLRVMLDVRGGDVTGLTVQSPGRAMLPADLLAAND